MRFGVLGPLEVSDGDGVLRLGGPKPRVVLAHLLLQANRVVTAERLIDAVWGEEPPETARNTIQTYIRHLRQAVGAERIEHRSSGYRLRAEPEEVDLLRFQALVEASRALKESDVPAAIEALREALGLWRGPALADVADHPSLRAEAARLDEVRLVALEDRLDAELGLGGHREIVPELETLIAEHPYRERLWGLLMVALYRSGRQGDALNAYRRARSVLMEELGIDPSPDLQRLQDQVLRQDVALEPGGEPLRGYQLLEQIGEGAFGTVHRAFQPEVGREVAVKVIRPAVANDPDYIRRFDAEAQLIARLEHPHIVPLYDYWREPDGAYLVMRYLRGGSLRQLLAHGALQEEQALRVIDQISLALSAAHRQGVAHRDVKPANILFDEDGNAYLSDFGIARDLTAGGVATTPSDVALYLSPEEARGERVTHLGDVYSLGVLLFEILTGRHPFADVPADRLRETHAREPLPSPRSVRPELPASVDVIVASATAKDPAVRTADVREVGTALRQALSGQEAPARRTRPDVRNPYKGLRSFVEADAADFFGRERAVEELVSRMRQRGEGAAFLAVVGPSGSGKSSLVRAGLVPALRGGALPGSAGWFVVELLPGAHPFEELDAALTRIAVNRHPGFVDRARRDPEALWREASAMLPGDDAELVVVIDQFEELFTLVEDEDASDRFLAALSAAATDPRSRVRIVVTLRADFYDRPLLHPGVGPLLAARTYTVAPLDVAELERAVVGPAEAVGVSIEPRLVAEIVAEVADRPGALPLLQYVLTELFDGRGAGDLTLEAYHRVGGVSGALARRAEALYARLGQTGREAARQLFLRLVDVGEDGTSDTRRRVPRSDLASMDVGRAAMEAAVDAFGARRLLTFDRDPKTRGPTVEVAHETLLREWTRLRGWIESAREDLRLQRRLSAAATEWADAGESPDYLLTGDRLTQAEAGARATSLRLTERERGYLAASVAQREAERATEAGRRAREARLERRAFVRLRALVAVMAVATLIASGLTIVAVTRSRESARSRDAAVIAGLTGSAVSNLRTDPELSLLLSLHAVHRSTELGIRVPAQTVEGLHWALQESRVQYPTTDARAVAVVSPLGTRGVFDLPIGELVALARSHAGRSLTPRECLQFLGTVSCQSLPDTFPAGMTAEPIRAVGSATSPPLAGTRVDFASPNDDGSWADLFQQDVASFTERTGIQIRVVGSAELHVPEVAELTPRDAPDLGLVPNPAALIELAREGQIMDLGAYLDLDELQRRQSPYLIRLGTIGPDGAWPAEVGTTFAAFFDLGVKSLIWYAHPELGATGHPLPATWEELVSLTNRLRSEGRTPWCAGFESGEASGWPGTDWIEDLLLAEAGPEVYDRWATGDLPFQSPEVRRAFERMATILFPEGNVLRGRAGIVETAFDFAQHPMVDRDPPACWLYHFPSFATGFLPAGSAGRDTNVFPFPQVDPRFPDPVVGAGNMLSAFADRPEVREAVRFLTGTEFGAALAASDFGFIPANSGFALDTFPSLVREQAEIAYAALRADEFRFDASDLMPVPVGAGAFWEGVMTYVEEGPASLNRVLAEIDAAWPDA